MEGFLLLLHIGILLALFLSRIICGNCFKATEKPLIQYFEELYYTFATISFKKELSVVNTLSNLGMGKSFQGL